MLKHMEIAQSQLGQKEVAGKEHNQRIVEYFTATTYPATEDEVPWCSAFANWVLFKAGIAGTKSAAALSFLDWGVLVKLKDVKYGDVAVFDRGGGRGHVGFVIGFDEAKQVGILGGNQNDEVNVAWFDPKDIKQFRRVKTLLKSKTVAAASAAAAGIAAGTTAIVNQTAKIGEAAASAASKAAATVEHTVNSTVTADVPQVLVGTDEIRQAVSILPDNWQIPAAYAFALVNVVFIIYDRWQRLKDFNR